MNKIAIVQFPGSNCERETIQAVKRAGMEAVEILWNESPDKLTEMDGFIIIGGFSYEDRSRAGVIAALDPIMQHIKAQAKLGKPVLGICNGAQILVETGMVPGVENDKVAMALTENKRLQHNKIVGTGYYNAWCYLKLSENFQRNAFTQCLEPNELMYIPFAHGEGRFVIPEGLLEEIKHQGLGVLQYCDSKGVVDANFPTNPNASVHNLAAVSNKSGNVMAMMPHPERTPNGDGIFKSMNAYIDRYKKYNNFKSGYLSYYPRPQVIKNYSKNRDHQFVSELMITDNQALTVEQALKRLGINAKVKRFSFWQVAAEHDAIDQIISSEVLFNPRKEIIYDQGQWLENVSAKRLHILVKPKDDILGENKLQILRDHFALLGCDSIHSGVIWQFESQELSHKDLLDRIIHSQIIMNGSAHDGYYYQPTTAEHYSAGVEALSA